MACNCCVLYIFFKDNAMVTPILDIKGLSKVYRGRIPVHALDDVNLIVYEGEVLSLLGVNGAGKTTLSSILATLHPPTAGDVLYQGQSIYKNLRAYRRVLGYCPQQPNLDNFLNVRDNLVFAGRYCLMSEDRIQQRVEELLKHFNMNSYAHADIATLSGGYKQRVSIARALIHNPRIIVLDEPTVGLDPNIRRQLWDIIRDLKAQGITVILTTHYLEEAEELSSRACILHRGKILLTETIELLKEVHKKERFEDIFIDLTQRAEDIFVDPQRAEES